MTVRDSRSGSRAPADFRGGTSAAAEGPAVEDLAADELINEDDLVLIHTGLRLDRMSTTKLMRDRLLSYPAPIWGSKLVMWKRIVQYEKDLARQRRTKQFIHEHEEAMQAPTDEEIEKHELLHIPSAPWCEGAPMVREYPPPTRCGCMVYGTQC